MKGRTHATMSTGRSYRVNFKWAQKGNGPKSLAPITSNNNGCQFDKNLVAMIGATSAQFHR
jgi:hypothetical protein